MKHNFKKYYSRALCLAVFASLLSCNKDETETVSVPSRCETRNINLEFSSDIQSFEVKNLQVKFYYNNQIEMFVDNGAMRHHDSDSVFPMVNYDNSTVSSDQEHPSALLNIPFHNTNKVELSYSLFVKDMPNEDHHVTKTINIEGLNNAIKSEDFKTLKFSFVPNGECYYKDGTFYISSDMRNFEFNVTIDSWVVRDNIDVTLE